MAVNEAAGAAGSGAAGAISSAGAAGTTEVTGSGAAEKAEIGVVIGRFQPFHLDHLRYVLAAKERCTRLIVGITNYDPTEEKPLNPYDEGRAERGANPFSYYERYMMIRTSLVEAGLDAADFDILPLPIEQPEKISLFVPRQGLFFITIYDAWGERKVELLRGLGFETEVLWQRSGAEKGISATDVRRLIAEGREWQQLVPAATCRFISDHCLEERVKSLLSPGNGNQEPGVNFSVRDRK